MFRDVMLKGNGDQIKNRFREALKDARSLNEVSRVVIVILKELKERGSGRLGYVSGIITSDSADLVELNERRLDGYTNYLRKGISFPVFSSTDIFQGEFVEKFRGNAESEWYSFWRSVLECGYVTDVFMTPRWRVSAGAKDEHETAKKVGLSIHYMDDHPELKAIMDSHKK